jgi:predicted enzyme related to lactoylglutathione lyase
MEISGLGIIINSPDPARLFAFYRDTVGLPLRPEMGEHALAAAGAGVTFDTHDQVGAAAREPARILLNLFVEDAAAERRRMEAQGVTFIRKEGKESWGGIISTFADPDGNYVQLIQFSPGEG